MAEETLRITITAENKDALAKFNQTISSLDGISTSSGKTGKEVTKMGTNFTGLSRVIQDLPYGFNAISNNLTQLLPAAGAAGLAFSALIAALDFAQIGFVNWTRGSKNAKEESDAIVKSITDLNVELSNSKNNFAAAKQGVMSKKEALDKYNSSLGSSIGYAKTIQEAEQLMVANTATVIKALQLRTQAQIYQSKAAEMNARLVSGEMFNISKSWTEFAAISVKNFIKGMNVGQMFTENVTESIAEQNNLTQQATKNIQEAINLEKTLKKGTGSATEEKAAKGETEESKEKKALAEMIKAREAYFAEIDRMAADAELKKDQRRLRAMKGEFDPVMQEKAKQKDITNLKLTMDGNTALNQVMIQQTEIEKQRIANLGLANSLTDRAMQGISGVINAMANGGNIGQAFGDMFKQLAIDIALAAAKAAIFQAILTALNPVGGAGKAGGFLKGFGKLLGFSQGGTVSGPQSGYPVMLHGTEHIVRPDQMKSIIASAAQMGGSAGGRVEVYGRIQGQDIWLSQQRTNTFRNLSA